MQSAYIRGIRSATPRWLSISGEQDPNEASSFRVGDGSAGRPEEAGAAETAPNHSARSSDYGLSRGHRAPLDFPIGRGDIAGGDLGDRSGTTIAHRQFQFTLKDFEHPIDARLAECSQSPQEGTPDSHGSGAKREGLEHIRAAAKAAVDEDGNTVADFGHDFGQRLDSCAGGFCGTSAVV